MAQIPKHRKVKRTTVLIKRTQCLKSYSKGRSYKPLCEKLKINNNSLAKALSKEKQESQLLFSQNVALVAEVQDLGLACSKSDAVISNVLKNANEMLKMLVTMTGYLTNTISCCQEFAATSVTNLRMSCNSAGRRESCRRLSTKSPTRGVVKPMVSGHTITKPTINLSRVNMQHFNNPSNLSIIQEVATPPRNQVLNSPRSPIAVGGRQRRCENGRACRMPERLTVVSPRNKENERRLSKRSSRRSRPKSDRLSASKTSRRSIDNFQHITSPRVKLNDVSKLLQNSQSINIRMLTGSRNDHEIVNSGNSSLANHQDSSRIATTIPETSSSDNSNIDDYGAAAAANDDDRNVDDETEENDKNSENVDETIKENPTETQAVASNLEDPLEGPSWLFNNSQTVPCYGNDEKTDALNVTSDNSTCSTLKATELSDESDSERCMHQTISLATLNKRGSQLLLSKKGKRINNRHNESTLYEENGNSDTACNTPKLTIPTNATENMCRMESRPFVNSANFVTQRRGYFESEDEDDFTLMQMRQQRDVDFDINDLKLPALEESSLNRLVRADPEPEPQPEITATLRHISQICPIPPISNNSLDESAFNQSTAKLPLLMNNDYDNKDLTTMNDTSDPLPSKKSVKKKVMRFSSELSDSTPTSKKKNKQKKKKNKEKLAKKDPSAAKVVLQKLNESDVKSRTPSPQAISHDYHRSLSPVCLPIDNSSDSESSSASINSMYTLNRPRRKRAPTSLQEPNLRKKLRRNH
ncbi:uncharacterized protein LOC143376601 isoform X3 [Andrena cerasifolii]|uniref:uncharacterized protein LOC143376601 isoform X3 n=1 Tax=Andrena cerasifolii TaxID=2819439 RepID=UPI0040377C95